MLCDLWFDAIDERVYTAKNGSYVILVFDKDQGYNFIDIGTHKQVLDRWYQSIKYMEHGFFLVKEGGKLNIYEPILNSFVLPQWFDDHGVPQILDEHKFAGLWLGGKPVQVIDGKIVQSSSEV